MAFLNDGPPDVVVLNKLDAALLAIGDAERNEDVDALNQAITDVAAEWIQLDQREQMCRLRYWHANKPMGARLRTALHFANQRYDLGECAANLAEERGQPW